MIPKPLYELVPYICLTVGSGSVISHSSLLGVIAGVMLYAAGSLIWLMRFNHRYPVPKKFARRGGFLPETIYEFKPFIIGVPVKRGND